MIRINNNPEGYLYPTLNEDLTTNKNDEGEPTVFSKKEDLRFNDTSNQREWIQIQQMWRGLSPLRVRELMVQDLMRDYPEDGEKEHKAFLDQILLGRVSGALDVECLTNFKKAYLKEVEIDLNELAFLLLDFSEVLHLATAKQRGQLLTEFVAAIVGKKVIEEIKACLHLTFTVEELGKIFKTKKKFFLPACTKLKIKNLDSFICNPLHENLTNGKLQARDILDVFQQIAGKYDKRLRFCCARKKIGIDCLFEHDLKTLSIKFDTDFIFNSI